VHRVLANETPLNQFRLALDSGDVDSLRIALSEDAGVVTDGGGFTNAARRPIVWADNVSRCILRVTRKFGIGTHAYRFANINHPPAYIGYAAFDRESLLPALSLQWNLVPSHTATSKRSPNHRMSQLLPATSDFFAPIG